MKLFFIILTSLFFISCSLNENYKHISLKAYKIKMVDRCKLIRGPKKREDNATFYSFKTIEEECKRSVNRILELDKIDFINEQEKKMLNFCKNKKNKEICYQTYQKRYYSNKVGVFFNERF